jgi:hypothetical protein
VSFLTSQITNLRIETEKEWDNQQAINKNQDQQFSKVAVVNIPADQLAQNFLNTHHKYHTNSYLSISKKINA